MEHDKSFSTKIALKWLRNYEHLAHFWPRFCWVMAMTFFIIGALEHWPLGPAILGIVFGNLILNAGVFFAIRGIRSHLETMPESYEREEAHDLMIGIIRRRIERG